MSDQACVEFLQWSLPNLQFRWQGFRKVRKQVCKRIRKRLQELGLSSFVEYKKYLEIHAEEWEKLESYCFITISRFYRDKKLHKLLTTTILPQLGRQTMARKARNVQVWSVGSCSGEEPYTLQIIWKIKIEPVLPTRVNLHILATEIKEYLIERAQQAVYSFGSLKQLPAGMRKQAFYKEDDRYILREVYRENIQFKRQDIRVHLPDESFDLILCRNLVFTYFTEDLQRELLRKMLGHLLPGGYFIIGSHETLPQNNGVLRQYSENFPIYVKK